MNPLTQSKHTTILPVLIALTLACFALAPPARAVCQEGCLGSNTFLGDDALLNNTSGFSNTAIGFDALFSNTDGFGNTAIGEEALFSNTEGFFNTAIGVQALEFNTTGNFNTAIGEEVLFNNTTGKLNTATGQGALFSNRTGSNNAAAGDQALALNSTGNFNTAIGESALFSNTAGSDNIALGFSAGFNLTTGDRNIDIGNGGLAGESSTIRIGTQGGGRTRGQTATYIAGINGAGVMGVAVKVSAAGQLGTAPSSARFKEEIQPMDKASEAIFVLKPVSFRYKKEIDPDRIPQFGLVAEDVATINPDLVARDEQGKPYTVRYEAVNAMLLNEFLKEHRKNEQQEATIVQLKSTVAKQGATAARQQKQIEALTVGLQKVSAQLEVSKPAPQTVLNNQ